LIIVDSALRQREAAGNPIRVGLVGAGAIGRAMTFQLENVVPGMRLAAIANRTLAHAERAYRDAGVDPVRTVSDAASLDAALDQGCAAITGAAHLLCRAPAIDVIFESTGTIEFAAGVVLEAIAHGKHVVTLNAELQGTLGPLLKAKADHAGVVLSEAEGDQPGVMMNLFRFVRGIGVRPVLVGNVKGLYDRYRTPATQAGFARRHGLTPHMAASFADGTKMSFENAVIANATGFKAGRRGFYGPACGHVRDAAPLFSLEQMLDTGLVDYVLGAEPGPGVFVIAHEERALPRQWLQLHKMGDGPLYTFYVPYHLGHMEAPFSIGRAVLFGDAAVAPHAGHVVDVVATAKRDLAAGEVLDGIGHYTTYGQCENVDVVRRQSLLPMGVAEGCRLWRDVAKDQVLTYDDVELPAGRLTDRLRAEQTTRFAGI